ncbi:MAG: DUF2179 domain-containing protein [Tissierellales bacterium]|nr:DUF2179 domain-containing protein [Tissierellales bacterium]
MEAFLGYAIIFFARVLDVSLATIRTLMVVQGRKVQAAAIGFFEVGIYVTILGRVVTSLDNPLNLLAYCLGFATGNYVGIILENRIALGNLFAQIIPGVDKKEELLKALRENGFGVTVIVGEGLKGSREIFNVVLNRKDLTKLRKIVESIDKNAFLTINNISPIRGGYFNAVKK